MKICFVTHAVKKGDGQGRVNYEVIVEALHQGHEIVVISSELSDELQNHERVEWIRMNLRKVPTALLRYQLFAWLSACWIWTNRRKLDLVVVNGFITYARSDINCIHFVHSAWVKSKYHPYQEQKNARAMYQWLYNSVNALLERHALKRTKQIVAVSEQVKQELIQDARVNPYKVSVISNGVDLNEFYPRTVNREDFNLDVHTTYALFAGDLKSSRKNLDTVLEALTQVDHIHLLVLGYAEKSVYPHMAERLGISQRVHFLGYRRDIAEIMSLADMFIFPSRYEPFSLVILEAMASGLPVITSSRCGAVELLSDDSAVVMEDPDDTETLVNALRELVSNKERLETMSLRAREDARKNSWGNMSNQYMHLINRALGIGLNTGKASLKG
ncbi:glycosyltransferase family 4 protein [Paenibacillus solani]|uniref:glycosyltransferase family 4 protein n=1 Tax=Paenibacillus solani TaxID=1705565 RepID=UPI003D2CDC57